MATCIFFDTYALIELIRGNKNYDDYLSYPIITTYLNMGELYLYLLREFNKKTAQYWFNILQNSLVSVDAKTIISAMELKHKKRKLSFVDCVSYTFAKERDLLYLTGDKEFKGLPGVKLVPK